MPALYEIDKTLEQLIEYGFAFDEDTGEVTFDSSAIDDIAQDREKKLVACACWVKNQRALAQAIRDEERKLAVRRRSIERKVESFENYMLASVERYGGMEAPECSIGTRRSSRVLVDDPGLLPEPFRRVKVEPDKAAIRDALKSGTEVPGASLEERTLLRIS